MTNYSKIYNSKIYDLAQDDVKEMVLRSPDIRMRITDQSGDDISTAMVRWSNKRN